MNKLIEALQLIANSNTKLPDEKNVLKAQLMWIRSVAASALQEHANNKQNHIGEANKMVEQVPDVRKMAEEVYGKDVNQDYEEGFVDGYNKAKKTLYTKEQLMEIIELARLIDFNGPNVFYMSEDEIIKALKP